MTVRRERDLILALDQGTTSSRAIVFNDAGEIVTSAQQPIAQLYPRPGWVNQDAGELWESVRAVTAEVLSRPGILDRIVAVGITNQRETTVLWERATGRPVAPALVWQSRQSAAIVDRLVAEGQADRIQAVTGLVPDAYFSATKLAWLFADDPTLSKRAKAGELAFGTVDSWLIWNLTGGRAHLTDVTNASRTMLLDLRTAAWSPELLAMLDIPAAILPTVVPSAGAIAVADRAHFGRELPISGLAGDQQAALFGQACFQPGNVKSTYGTGSFVLMNIGSEPAVSAHRLLSTMAWQIANDRPVYALEGAIFNTGSAVQWLRDGLGIIASAPEVEVLAASVPDAGGLMFVPALTGLGSPHWEADARGTILGITRGSTAGHLARATLEAIAFQTRDVVDAMALDSGVALAELRVDGGAAANDLLLQIQADLLGVPVVRPVVTETTALGAAFLAGIGVGIWRNEAEISALWREDRRFEPMIDRTARDARHARWRDAVRRSIGWHRVPDD